MRKVTIKTLNGNIFITRMNNNTLTHAFECMEKGLNVTIRPNRGTIIAINPKHIISIEAAEQ